MRLSLLTLLISQYAFAGLQFELASSAAIGKAQQTAGTQPTLFQGGGSVGLGYQFASFVVGANSSLFFLNQYSALDSETGNYQGLFLNFVGPFVAFQPGRWAIRLEAILFAEYRLNSSSYSGATLKFTKPVGARFSIERGISQGFRFGLFYQWVSFSSRVSSSTGTTSLSPKQELWQAGALIRFVL